MSSDYLVRATACQGQLRAFALTTTSLVQEAVSRHHLFPVATAALGRTLTMGLVLGAMAKSEETVTIQVRGDGPLRGIVVSADSRGSVRGYVYNPFVDLPLSLKGKLAVGEAVGTGTLWVIRDLGLKEPYVGSVPLVSGEIGEDFVEYFAQSEQTPSVVSLGVLVNPDSSCAASGGYVISVMPGIEEEVLETLERRLPSMLSVSTLIHKGKAPEDILYLLLGDLGLELKGQTPVQFSCPCSRERFSAGLLALGFLELQELAETEEPLELVCHFCNQTYDFQSEEIRALRDEVSEKTRRDPL